MRTARPTSPVLVSRDETTILDRRDPLVIDQRLAILHLAAPRFRAARILIGLGADAADFASLDATERAAAVAIERAYLALGCRSCAAPDGAGDGCGACGAGYAD